jgi:hypothetical protein
MTSNNPIDRLLADAWKAAGVEPAPLVDPARRMSLDLLGRIPLLGERRTSEDMLASPEFPRFWSEVWTAMLVGYTSAFESNREALRIWLEKRFAENRPFDKIAAELVAADGASATSGPVNFVLHHSEDPAPKVARTFLGVRLDCARCHDHPFDRWTQDDYKGMRDFFAPVERRPISEGNVRIVDNPDRGGKPRFLTGATPVTRRWREELALYITSNKAFARAFANRLWYHFMGRGLVDPPDDASAKNKASVPELLELLADEARRTSFDLRAMIRLIVGSDAYRRARRRPSDAPALEALFAARVLKPMLPEQVFDSLVAALGLKANRAEFLKSFTGRSFGEDLSNAWTYRETVQDLLTKLSLEPRAPEKDVDALYRRLLSRPPKPREIELCEGRSAEDVVFALANSNEFYFNH